MAATWPAGWRSPCARCSSGTRIWFGWSGTVSRDEDIATKTRSARRHDLCRRPTSPRPTIRNITTASPIGCCGRYSTTASTSRSFHAAISAAIGASTRISPNQLHRLLQPDDIVWVHDYHLIPLAKMLRERGHRNRIGFFLHVPFPPPEILTALPQPRMAHSATERLRSGRLSDRERRDEFRALSRR